MDYKKQREEHKATQFKDMLEALHNARVEAMTAAANHRALWTPPDPQDPAANTIEMAAMLETVLFACERAILRGSSAADTGRRKSAYAALTKLYRAANAVLAEAGMENDASDAVDPHADTVDPARVLLATQPGNRFVKWDEFEDRLLEETKRLIAEGIGVCRLSVWLNRFMLVAPVPGGSVSTTVDEQGRPVPDDAPGAGLRAPPIEQAIEQRMADRHWLDERGRVRSDDRNAIDILIAAMRAVGITTRVRKTPFEYRARKRPKYAARKKSADKK